MGRSSALILQAVCLAGWLTERQADAYVIAAKRHDREAASAGSLSVRKNRQAFLFTLCATRPRDVDQSYWRRKSRYIAQVGGVVDHLTQRVTSDLFLSPEHDW